MTQYIIGIDLGTTNCTMAYRDLSGGDLCQFEIPQVVSAGTQNENPSLPSFIYFPLQQERDSKSSGIAWDSNRRYAVGIFARDRGGEIPSRLIGSAKSWLCFSGIDRRQKLLPLNAEEDTEKMSPLEACSLLLIHLREAWENKMPVAPFESQQILITVPASFDPSARQLVQEAARLAGYPEVILLEEPQAAFYAWLHKNESSWRKNLKVGDCILVIDIGGGTTDFSLISVAEENGELTLNRQAVGDHLLLGGDNIDLSLAYLAKQKLEEQGHAIDDWQLQNLVHSCRNAKERLLSAEAPKSADIAIMGRGSKLIKGTLKTKITLEEIQKIVVDGFMPLVSPQDRSPTERRIGIQQVGLPYAQDARISCQLAKFLSMTGETDNNSLEQFVIPSHVLFNGGTLKGTALRQRLIDQLNQWANHLKKEPVKELPGPDFDFAVSRGAVYYGMARAGQAIRIKSGTERSYFVGVEDAMPAIPGFAPPLKAICVVPFGMEEGSEMELNHQEFALVVGEQATFRFFSCSTPKLSNGEVATIGTSLKNWKQELKELHPIETFLEGSESDGKTVRVKLKSRVTELGVLELWCVAHDGRKWKLEFDVRAQDAITFAP